MPIIATGKSTMESSIKAAFVKAKNDGAKDGASSDAIIAQLSTDIASAVDSYVTSITVMINPGIPITGVGAMGPVSGATTAPGSS